MVSSDPRGPGAIYYNIGYQYAAQWYVSAVSGRMGPWGPGVVSSAT